MPTQDVVKGLHNFRLHNFLLAPQVLGWCYANMEKMFYCFYQIILKKHAYIYNVTTMFTYSHQNAPID